MILWLTGKSYLDFCTKQTNTKSPTLHFLWKYIPSLVLSTLQKHLLIWTQFYPSQSWGRHKTYWKTKEKLFIYINFWQTPCSRGCPKNSFILKWVNQSLFVKIHSKHRISKTVSYTLRSWVHENLILFRIFSPQLEDNDTFKCSSNNFS